MDNEKILEIARRYVSNCDLYANFYVFTKTDLIAFAQSVLEEEQEKYQELIAAAEAIVMTQDIYGGIPTKIVDHLRDVLERMKNDDR